MNGRRSPGEGDQLTNFGLALFAFGLGIGCLLWLGAALATGLTSHHLPTGGLPAAYGALSHTGEPALSWADPKDLPGPIAYWASTLVVFAVATVAAVVLLRLRRSLARPAGGKDVRRLPGLATTAEATSAAGSRQLLRRGPVMRPSVRDQANVQPRDVGYLIGRTRGRELWCGVEDSVLLIGPPRMGKGLHVVIPWVLDAPGAVVATSTRPDTLAVTARARSRRGPVAIFDPQRLAGLRNGLRWSPVRGCETPRTALVRARGLAAGAGWGKGVSEGDFWLGQTETALRCLLHAAALDGRGAVDLYRWSLNPARAVDAITILTRSPNAAAGWADALDASVHGDPRTRDSVWLGVRQSFAALADPDVLDAVDPAHDEAFDPTAFLSESGTLYLLASAVASASCAPLVAAFVEDITESARSAAARAPGARLDPPLLLALDEIANLTPLPSLPSLMAEGGGSGITTLAVLQSLAQARHRWGEHAADSIWDAATVKVILGGLAKMRDLEDVARLLGDIDEPTQTVSRGGQGERSSTVSMRQVPVMPPSVLRTLPFGTGVLLLRQTRPLVVDLAPWPRRADAANLAVDQGVVEAAMAGRSPLDLTSKPPP